MLQIPIEFFKYLIYILIVINIKDMSKTLVICRGIQGSGKSTWAKKWVAKDPAHRIRLNLDDFRNMFGPYWVPEREEAVYTCFNNSLRNLMMLGYDIVVDNMNLSSKNLNFLESMAEFYNYSYRYKEFFDISLKECLRRNANRENKIPESVIINTYNKYNYLFEK